MTLRTAALAMPFVQANGGGSSSVLASIGIPRKAFLKPKGPFMLRQS
jgi:hypothetical protein